MGIVSYGDISFPSLSDKSRGVLTLDMWILGEYEVAKIREKWGIHYSWLARKIT